MQSYYAAQLARLTEDTRVVIQLANGAGRNTNWLSLSAEQFRKIAEILKMGDVKNATH